MARRGDHTQDTSFESINSRFKVNHVESFAWLDCLHILINRYRNTINCSWKRVRKDHASHNDQEMARLDSLQVCFFERQFGNMIHGTHDVSYLHILWAYPRKVPLPVRRLTLTWGGATLPLANLRERGHWPSVWIRDRVTKHIE